MKKFRILFLFSLFIILPFGSVFAQNARFEILRIISPANPSPAATYKTETEATRSVAGKLAKERRVLPYEVEAVVGDAGPNPRTRTIIERGWVVAETLPIIDERSLKSCEAVANRPPSYGFRLSCILTESGEERLGRWMGANINNYLGILIDGRITEIAYIKSRIGNEIKIRGQFPKAEASALVSTLTPQAGGTVRNSVGMELVYVPAGSFMMGSSEADITKTMKIWVRDFGNSAGETPKQEGWKAETPQHRVTIINGFYMATTEVTQGQWKSVMGTNIRQQRDKQGDQYPLFGEGARYPMYWVSWDDAKEFIRRLNNKNDGFEYRLPTEAEWEYAARAGTTTLYYWGDDPDGAQICQYAHRVSCEQTLPLGIEHPTAQVGSLKPNNFGLFDMSGNVLEWVEDLYNKNGYRGLSTDGSANIKIGDKTMRVLRGGSQLSDAGRLRSANREDGFQVAAGGHASGNLYGFRIVAQPKYLQRTVNNNGRSSVTLTGYIDIVETSGSGCKIRIIAGDKTYIGIVGFGSLSALTGRRIRTYEDALAFFESKQIRATLSGLTASGNFTGMSQLIVVASPGPKPTTQQWKETTTATETIIDLSTDILFDFNKSTINPKAVPSLIKLARLLRQSNGNSIQLNGFTDSIGTDEYNIGLSQRRSEAVKQWLVSKGGIDNGRLNTNGYGKAQPVAPNSNADGSDNPAGRQKNRRVEIRIPRR